MAEDEIKAVHGQSGAELKTGVLVTLSHSPYGSSLARAAVDTLLAGAAFDQPVALLLSGAGVLNLLPEQNARVAGARNLGKLLASLPMYDIDIIYVDAAAVEQFGIDPQRLPDAARLLDRAAIRRLMDAHRHLLGF